LVTYYKL